MRKLLIVTIALCGFAFTALAAEDAAGKWKATLETPNGAQENTFDFKVDGSKLTGSISGGMMGTVQIADGKVDGDKITFSITSDFGVIRYSGTIKGDDMKLTLTAGEGQFTLDFAAKRQK